jgi:hypothetical protein
VQGIKTIVSTQWADENQRHEQRIVVAQSGRSEHSLNVYRFRREREDRQTQEQPVSSRPEGTQRGTPVETEQPSLPGYFEREILLTTT